MFGLVVGAVWGLVWIAVDLVRVAPGRPTAPMGHVYLFCGRLPWAMCKYVAVHGRLSAGFFVCASAVRWHTYSRAGKLIAHTVQGLGTMYFSVELFGRVTVLESPTVFQARVAQLC